MWLLLESPVSQEHMIPNAPPLCRHLGLLAYVEGSITISYSYTICSSDLLGIPSVVSGKPQALLCNWLV